MAPVLDKPMLEHVLAMLHRAGITQACITLRYLPEDIRSYFDDGARFGMKLEYIVEKGEAGTAGGVGACADYIGKGDFVVVSGDAVCDFDLRPCLRAHLDSRADATIVLCRHPQPLEYGIVLTDERGRITDFVEKPSWDRVHGDLVNTGIYFLSPRVFERIPAGVTYDFGKDLFPEMLKSGAKLFGVTAQGYWCDAGTPEAYLKCNMDALDGLVKLDAGAPEVRKGIRSLSKIPPGVEVMAPSYIGSGVTLSKGAKIGPHAVIGSGSAVGAGAAVKGSVVASAHVGAGAKVFGAVLCSASSVGDGTVVSEGCVIGENCVIGAKSMIMPKVRIWNDRTVPDGEKVSSTVTVGMLARSLPFGPGGTISGACSSLITAENCMKLGEKAGAFGRVGVSSCGGEAAGALASAFSAGVRSRGGNVAALDCAFEAETAFAARLFGLDLAVHIRQDGEQMSLAFFGPRGAAITRGEERRLEKESPVSAPAGAFGRCDGTYNVRPAYIAACVGDKKADRKFFVRADGRGSAYRVLCCALKEAGFEMEIGVTDVPVLEVACDGRSVRALDEHGGRVDDDHILAMLILDDMENGAREIAVPYSAPAALERVASAFGRRSFASDVTGARKRYMLRGRISVTGFLPR